MTLTLEYNPFSEMHEHGHFEKQGETAKYNMYNFRNCSAF